MRVEDIAEAAGVSPRTYNNYFSSRDQAIVAAVTTEREVRVGAAVTARAPEVGLADAITERLGAIDEFTAPVLAAGVAAAIRVALEQWLQPASDTALAGFVVVSGSLPDLLRAALAPLVPALDDADVRAGSA